jgi:hypothetical protein
MENRAQRLPVRTSGTKSIGDKLFEMGMSFISAPIFGPITILSAKS